MSPQLIKQKKQQRKFIEQLLAGSKVDPYEIPVKINAELRTYQKVKPLSLFFQKSSKEGINWLNFLRKYRLHGCLCDGSYFLLVNFLLQRYGTRKDLANHLHSCKRRF